MFIFFWVYASLHLFSQAFFSAILDVREWTELSTSNNSARKQLVSGSSSDFVEPIFREEIFSDDFRLIPVRKTGSSHGSTGKTWIISGWNMASLFQRFQVFSYRIQCPESSTWVLNIEFILPETKFLSLKADI
jgi:hypothetical protein